jgi:hypothetical protein
MICLSFDTDHMSEARLAEFLSIYPIGGRATFFCTQRYACLAGTPHEQAPHPLLEWGTDFEKELSLMRETFPEAKGWRAHSCAFSHNLAIWLCKHRYEYVSTHDQFGQAGIAPFRVTWGIWQLPIYYMDTLDISAERFGGGPRRAPFKPELIRHALESSDLHVFDFHPIHIMLNSPDADYYFSKRDRFRVGDLIEELRFPGYGAGSFFSELCRDIERAALRSFALEDALSRFIEHGTLSQVEPSRFKA